MNRENESMVNKQEILDYQLIRAREYIKKCNEISDGSEPTLETCIISDMVRQIDQLKADLTKSKDTINVLESDKINNEGNLDIMTNMVEQLQQENEKLQDNNQTLIFTKCKMQEQIEKLKQENEKFKNIFKQANSAVDDVLKTLIKSMI